MRANVEYGNGALSDAAVRDSLDAAGFDRRTVGSTAGLDAPMGDAGGLVSGGEGQAVRFARGLARATDRARLVLLDEATHGMDRARRTRLSGLARRRWNDATLLFATHDIAEALTFERVVVVHDGQIVEDGLPATLAQTPDSAFAALLTAERGTAERLWATHRWRRLDLRDGAITDVAEDTEP